MVMTLKRLLAQDEDEVTQLSTSLIDMEGEVSKLKEESSKL